MLAGAVFGVFAVLFIGLEAIGVGAQCDPRPRCREHLGGLPDRVRRARRARDRVVPFAWTKLKVGAPPAPTMAIDEAKRIRETVSSRTRDRKLMADARTPGPDPRLDRAEPPAARPSLDKLRVEVTELTDWRSQIRAPPARGPDRCRRSPDSCSVAGSRHSARLRSVGGGAGGTAEPVGSRPLTSFDRRLPAYRRQPPASPSSLRARPDEDERLAPHARDRRHRLPRLAPDGVACSPRRRGPGDWSARRRIRRGLTASTSPPSGPRPRPTGGQTRAARRRPGVSRRRHHESEALPRASRSR